MSTSILLAEPDKKFSVELKNELMKSSFDVDVAVNGKECQLKVFQKKFTYVVINFEIQQHSVFEVLNYLKSNSSAIKIIVSVTSSRRDEVAETLKKFVISSVITYPYTKSELIACIEVIKSINSPFLSGLASADATIEEQIKAAKEVTNKYIETVYSQGLSPALFDNGNKLGDAIHQMVMRNKDFHLVLQKINDYGSDLTTHPFWVAFFSMLMCKTLNWDSPRTIQVIAIGGLLHDIGLTRLPKEMREYRPESWNSEQRAMYEIHPKLGIDVLQEMEKVPEPIIQIVYQHHETSDGLGYPNLLSDTKIFPLAKVVILANHFSRFIMTKNLTPFEGLKEFIVDRGEIQKFDPVIIKSLIKCFMKADKEK